MYAGTPEEFGAVPNPKPGFTRDRGRKTAFSERTPRVLQQNLTFQQAEHGLIFRNIGSYLATAAET
jgi:hypothetical protein